MRVFCAIRPIRRIIRAHHGAFSKGHFHYTFTLPSTAKRFVRASSVKIEELLRTLVTLGQARDAGDDSLKADPSKPRDIAARGIDY